MLKRPLLVRSRAKKSRCMLTTSGRRKDVPKAVRWNIGFKPNCRFMQPAHWTRLARLESGQTNRGGIRAAILLFLFPLEFRFDLDFHEGCGPRFGAGFSPKEIEVASSVDAAS